MLKPASSRNQRSKSMKVKHALQICLLLAICIWLLYEMKQSCNKSKPISTQVSDEEKALPLLKLGRKDIKPQLLDEEVDLQEEESKDKETVDGDEEIEEGEKDKNEDEGEPQQLQDLIDDDDKDE